METLLPGDTLVVWRLDRLGRSLKHLIEVVTELGERDVAFHSITEAIDTSTAGGRLIFHIMGALAEFERQLISERTHAGLQAARARGRHGGRPAALSADQVTVLRQLYDQREHTVAQIAKILGISRATVYRYLESTEQRQATTPPTANPEQRKDTQ